MLNLFVVGMSLYEGLSPVDLLDQNTHSHLVREGEGGEAQ
jgi:hypothetical protein